jgi:hypothetical protein
MGTNHGVVRFNQEGDFMVTPKGNNGIPAVRVTVYDNNRSPLPYENDAYKVTTGEVKVFKTKSSSNWLLFTPTEKNPVYISMV